MHKYVKVQWRIRMDERLGAKKHIVTQKPFRVHFLQCSHLIPALNAWSAWA